ncbi:MAG TPA: hypothetical protein VKU84_14885, partial [Stellaceae bacterium]|nr:hypothetical protein [Stellaceae bacterium]
MRGEHFDALVRCGVSRRWLFGGAMRFGVAEIETYADGSYQPAEGGRVAIVLPETPYNSDVRRFEDHDPGDLVGFFAEDPERWFRRQLMARFLNPEAIERADYLQERLRVWRSPLAWL